MNHHEVAALRQLCDFQETAFAEKEVALRALFSAIFGVLDLSATGALNVFVFALGALPNRRVLLFGELLFSRADPANRHFLRANF